ncbi:DUF4157 domain-containing protein [Pelomonas cellulosilytica]|uniref:DUF4157 domain-containing protein n=1 Tax=Pelomonas cellulosilytica TaxID=2906762 RepID=A0ABS8XSR7_9BURK|nr:DUF4157 domain-containing protein [Pelomonas sp. P8]MCE4554335.1 DUF4157 domain-containing protein [Pelomonas sp. P8]
MKKSVRDTLSVRHLPAAQRDNQQDNGHLPAQSAAASLQQTQSHRVSAALGTPVQRTAAPTLNSDDVTSRRLAAPVERAENRTGMPDALKAGIESLAGMDMSDVRVHRDSGKPAQLNAFAYAQGNDIHLGPGQEHHLPHEAWHVVQQAQGRVSPTGSVGGVALNDDARLEREADEMGIRALDGARAAPTVQRLSFGQAPPAIAQLVNFPKDSTGSLDDVKTKVGEGDKEREVTGTKLQEEILELARTAGQEGGYRLGSYYLSHGGQLARKREADDEKHGMPLLPETFDVAPLDELVKPYIFLTLGDAKQLDYIKENADQIFKTHDVVIDVDCQFDRTGQVGFHKDSRGTTTFVNLTFTNDKSMQGTENYEDLEGDPGLEEKLPEEVRRDIEKRRVEHKEPDVIRAPRLREHGRISFSDPNIYHSTPLLGHRKPFQGETLTYGYIKKALDGMLPKGEELGTDMNHWVQLYKKYIGGIYSSHGFEELSKRKETRATKQNATLHRTRALSTDLSSTATRQWLAEQVKLTRTFIRTWVRFVPRVG